MVFNPYLPAWEYIPDGEPRVFDGRVYIFGSHDAAGGFTYCPGDYIAYSAPENDLAAWRYEGVIYPRTADPENHGGEMLLFAPDVVQGVDGRFYLYYVLNARGIVAVAVCDAPAGKYEFLGHVRYADGTRLGEREGDEHQFDPAVLCEKGRVYLYTGFCAHMDKTRTGCMVTVLDSDMMTVLEAPDFVIPGAGYDAGRGVFSQEMLGNFKGHEYFEAPSIRKIGEVYYLVYSGATVNQLCYATSASPTEGFVFRGVIVSNCDIGIDSYKRAHMSIRTSGNNHGGLAQINGEWYIFYHRHTHGTNFSRQACAEKVHISPDGFIAQVEVTSAGLNTAPLPGAGIYPAYIACNLFSRTDGAGAPMHHDTWMDARYPKIVQDNGDVDAAQISADTPLPYICNLRSGCVAGFKYFDCKGVNHVSVTTRGASKGRILVKTELDGEALGEISVWSSFLWTKRGASIAIPDGVQALYFEYEGEAAPSLLEFELHAG